EAGIGDLHFGRPHVGGAEMTFELVRTARLRRDTGYPTTVLPLRAPRLLRFEVVTEWYALLSQGEAMQSPMPIFALELGGGVHQLLPSDVAQEQGRRVPAVPEIDASLALLTGVTHTLDTHQLPTEGADQLHVCIAETIDL